MLTRDVLAPETPLSNPERLHAFRQKLQWWRLEQWYELGHPDAPALQVEDVARRDEIPAFLKRQAE